MPRKSAKLAKKLFPDGITPCDPKTYEDAYNMPDNTPERSKIRSKAMRAASKERSLYARVAAPYLAAKRTVDLYDGYSDLSRITADYEAVIDRRDKKHAEEEAEHRRLTEEQRIDAERRKAEKRIKRQ